MCGAENKPANRWFHIPIQSVGVFFCVYFYFHVPKSGKALLLLGGIAAVMMLMDMRPLHKGIYISIILGLVLIENHALDKERADFAREDGNRRKEENDRFQSIADGIQATIANSDKQFAATMGRTNQILQNVTGGDTLGFFVPQPLGEQNSLLGREQRGQPPYGGTRITS